MSPMVQSLRPFREPSPFRLRRGVFLGAIAWATLLAQPARSQPTTYFGTAASMAFSCDASIPEFHGKAILILEDGIGGLYPGPPPDPERIYQIEGRKWWLEIRRGDITYTADPKRSTLNSSLGLVRPPTAVALAGGGTIEHFDESKPDRPKVAACTHPGWTFVGQPRPPQPHPGIVFVFSVNLARWIRFAARNIIRVPRPLVAEAAEHLDTPAVEKPFWVPITPCAAGTGCFGAPATNRADLLVRMLPLGGGRLGPAYLSLTGAGIEVWSRKVGETDADARAWLIAAASTAAYRPGFLDVVGYATVPGALTALNEAVDENEDPLVDDLPDPTNAIGEAAPPPPAGPWLTSATLPGFRFKARLGSAPLVKANSCPALAICLANTAAGPPEIVVRILPKQANGKRWAILGKFAKPAAGVWVEKIASHALNHYTLIERPALSPELPGIVDKQAFAP